VGRELVQDRPALRDESASLLAGDNLSQAEKTATDACLSVLTPAQRQELPAAGGGGENTQAAQGFTDHRRSRSVVAERAWARGDAGPFLGRRRGSAARGHRKRRSDRRRGTPFRRIAGTSQ